ncbi:Coq4 family protein [Nannocystis bainbridge]|uniref:Coq4 family protein n=1 Tax=Nannocystis bainbridge TaxID=2995303 RepID=A0ABT5E4F1_9BACT|nr:Coq4 family protein [Nannocystis bainbridge]MDC0720743.1 Coq4 family protein [Nannocystis bainbridge]
MQQPSPGPQEPTAIPSLPEGASLATRLRLGVRALNVLKNDAGHPIYGPLLNVCMDSDVYRGLARAWRDSEPGRRLLADRPTLQGRELDLDALARLPEGTLGHEFVRYFRANGIQPFVTSFPVENDVDYLGKRYRETHDLFHVITGYSTDELGEMELQAFVFGNLGVPSAALVLVFSTALRVRRDGVRGFGAYLGRLRAAYRRGRRSRELLSVAYERLWDQPVAVLSAHLCAPG